MRLFILFFFIPTLLFAETINDQLFGRAYLDNRYLNVSGDTATGDLSGPNLNHNEGMLTDPTITDAAGSAVSVTSATCLIRSDSTWNGDNRLYYKTVSADTALAVTDSSINYIYVTWNSGTPIYAATTDRSIINNSDIIPVARIYMDSGNIEYQMLYEYIGRSAAIRNFDRVMRIRGSAGIERESGLSISETATRVINLEAGVSWFGLSRKTLDAVAQGGAGVTSHLWYHSGGTWTETTITQYNNTQYDNGTNLVTLTANRYAVNWVYRNLVDDEIDVILGTGDYTQAQAESSTLPTPPTQLSNFYVLCGRIIVQKSSDTAYAIENISTTVFNQAAVTNHADLSGLTTGDDHTQYVLDAGDTMTGALVINFNTVAGPSTLAGTALSARGADNGQVRIATSSFGMAGRGAYANRYARGTAASPTAVQLNDELVSLEGWGYATTDYSVAPSVMVRGYSAEAWTNAKQGSYMSFWTTPTSTIIPVRAWTISSDASLLSGLNGTSVYNITTAGDINTSGGTMTGLLNMSNAYISFSNGYGLFTGANNFLLYSTYFQMNKKLINDDTATSTFAGDIRGKDFINTSVFTISRDSNNFIVNRITSSRTLIVSRDANNFVTGKTDGTTTWTYVRNSSNYITSDTVSP